MTVVDDARPFVSILMPIRNERNFIDRSLGSVLAQEYPAERFEVLVIDGMSDDGTRELVKGRIASSGSLSIRLLDNPQRIVAIALNIGTREARGDIILRVDGHCEIEPNHIGRCVELLKESSDPPAGVGGPIETVSESRVGRAIAAAMSSRFGVGGSAFRVGVSEPRTADTVPFPAYPRNIVETAGPYDEELTRNQDDEYNYRIRELGGRLVLDPALGSRYYSRGSLRRLWSQYFQYGLFKVRVLQKHPKQMSLRQFVPSALVLAIVAAVVVGAAPGLTTVAALGPLAYLVAVVAASIAVAIKGGLDLLPILPAAFMALHLGYGAGFLVGLLKFWNRWGDRSTQVGDRRLPPVEAELRSKG